jgi:hypothetical protein
MTACCAFLEVEKLARVAHLQIAVREENATLEGHKNGRELFVALWGALGSYG